MAEVRREHHVAAIGRILPALFVALCAAPLSAQAPAPSAAQPPPTPAPVPAEPPAPQAAPSAADPARLEFPPDTTGLVLVTIKADRVSDYDSVLAELQKALSTTTDEVRRRQGQGWQVYKAREADAKGNAIYVHVITSPVPGADYRPSIVLDGLVEALTPELLLKYRDAFAAAPTRLSLGLLGSLGTPPAPKPQR